MYLVYFVHIEYIHKWKEKGNIDDIHKEKDWGVVKHSMLAVFGTKYIIRGCQVMENGDENKARPTAIRIRRGGRERNKRRHKTGRRRRTTECKSKSVRFNYQTILFFSSSHLTPHNTVFNTIS